jgi:hypothetical protein
MVQKRSFGILPAHPAMRKMRAEAAKARLETLLSGEADANNAYVEAQASVRAMTTSSCRRVSTAARTLPTISSREINSFPSK